MNNTPQANWVISSITHLNLNLKELCRVGCLKETVQILSTTHNPSHVDCSTYLHLLQACIAKKEEALSEGKQIHSYINDGGFAFNKYQRKVVQHKLMSMYDKCGSLMDARKVFDQTAEPDVLSWNVIIAAYHRLGIPRQALALFHQMQRTSVHSDDFTLSTVLAVCANLASLKHGLQVHGKIVRCGYQSNVIVMNTLLDMYAKCGSVEKVHDLFDKMPQRDVVSWTAMVSGYVKRGNIEKARQLFDQMPQRNVFSWTAMITGYAQNGDLDEASRLFKEMPRRNVVSLTAMIAGYAQNGFLDEALRLFKEMPERNVVSWTAIIAGCAQNGLPEKALGIFRAMQLAGVKPSPPTFASILQACAQAGALKEGKEIHKKVMECGLLLNVVVVNALTDMYAKCGSMEKSRELFDKMPQRDVVSWTVIILGYGQNGLPEKALETFKEMQLAGVEPNPSTFASVLQACAQVGALEEGMKIHEKIMERRFLSDVVVANALIDMYANCGSMQKARELFDKMPERNTVSWNSIIAGYAQNCIFDEALRLVKEMPQQDVITWTAIITAYAQNGFLEKALECFKEMQLIGVKPNSLTFASILPACAKMGALEEGMKIHKNVMEGGFCPDVVVTNALIDMYAKSGSIEEARKLFDKMPSQNVVSWSTMIAGYGMHGYSKDALKLFELMKYHGTNPNRISFICVLFACSHGSLVVEGCKYFTSMTDSYCMMPTMEHYICMVDLLGRAGYLEEALNFIFKMPLKPSVVVWTCLLGSCRSYRNVRLGEFVGTHLFEVEPENAATYVLMSNIYAEMGRWDEAHKVRKLMKDKGIKKVPGCSWIEAQ